MESEGKVEHREGRALLDMVMGLPNGSKIVA